MRHIKLYETFKKELEFNSEKEIELTFRFLLNRNAKSETLKRKIKEKFVERMKPPFFFNDLIFHSFEIDYISDIPYKNNLLASEYAIKAKVSVDKDAPKNAKDLDILIKNGIIQFLKLEEDNFFQQEVMESIIVSFEYIQD
jgi:hypothetical protein